MADYSGPIDAGPAGLPPGTATIRFDGRTVHVETPLLRRDLPIVEVSVTAVHDGTIARLELEFVTEPGAAADVQELVDQLGHAWQALRAQAGTAVPEAEPHDAGFEEPEPVAVLVYEPPKVIRGPDLIADSPDWLILHPLSDTCQLSLGRLFAVDGAGGGGEPP